MASQKLQQKTQSRPNSPTKQPDSSNQRSLPVVQQSAPQGISSRLFGLLKKIPMQITSPSKEAPSNSAQVDHQYTPSENESEESEESEEEDEDDNLESMTESEEEEEDPLGDDQCQAIMENYILETSTRTNLLRNRIQTHFRPALRRRLDFELSRITPSIAQVTALDYHQRDQGILRHTMEYVARMAIEQKSLSIGMKRSQSQQEQIWDEIERNHHHKRKRQLTSGSMSSKSSKQNPGSHPPSSPNGTTTTNQTGRNPPRSKPPTSRSTQGGGGQNHKRTSSSIEPSELNPKLPGTPLMSEFKPVRLARRNESLLSVNGSPVISCGGEEAKRVESLTATTSTNTIASKFSELFPSTNSTTSLNEDHHHPRSTSGGSSNNSHHNLFSGLSNQNNQFTFVEKSRWKELENQLNSLQIDLAQRQKLDELLKGCLNFGDS